ncbi:MAG: Uma2 family endonuclease [bacterium]|nr:Uma2 family endonuclease [bacterium]
MPSVSHAIRQTQSRAEISYEEFLAQSDEDIRAEWVDGEIVLMGPASIRHQNLSDFLVSLMRAFAEAHDLGVVLSAPIQMKTGPELPGREPDVLFLAQDHVTRLRENHLDGPADLAVEIVSPESRLRDRGEKFAEYEMGGVREYWILDLELERADFYVLGGDGRYERRVVDAGGAYRSQVMPGFWLQVEQLWMQPLPPILQALAKLDLIRL